MMNSANDEVLAAQKSPYSDAMASELAELRQRGLTKNLTKHFTQSIKQVQAELAAAEEALQVLETRKANAKKFDPSSNEIAKLDMIFMKLSEWKKKCRQKEQETVMLYRRYVEQFGGSIKLATPEELTTPQKTAGVDTSSPAKSPLATAEVSELVKYFDEADGENGIPAFLRPNLVIDTSAQTPRALEEILEEESLQDGGDAPCKSLGITPRTVSMDSDDDDEESNSSIVSGLTTLNSNLTKEVLNDAANKVLEFVKHETDHIRKMLAVEEDAKSSSSRRSSASIADRSATSAENMVLKMQAILDEYKAEAEKNKSSTKPPVRRNDVGNEGEEWYEHWDDTFQRNFYVEKNSNRTQWQIPPTVSEVSSNSSNSVCESAAGTSSSAASSSMMVPTSPKVMDYTNFKPEAREVRRSTRVRKYRAQCRRQRNRRLAAFSFVVILAGATFAYCKQAHPEEVERFYATASAKIVSTMEWANIAPPEKLVFPASKDNQPQKTKAEVPPKADSKPEAPKAEPVAPVVQEADIRNELERVMQDVPKTFPKEVAALEDIEGGIVVFKAKKPHWLIRFFMALLGPTSLPEVEQKCRERGSFCGF